MQKQSTFLFDYRAAIALNNMAVSLLERGAFRHALDSLKDCVALMESALRWQQQQLQLDDADSVSSLQEHQDLVSSMIQRACSCLSRSPMNMCPENLCVIHHDGTFLQSPQISWCKLHHHQSNVMTPIRLETFDHQCLEERNPDLESGIMLYNFGLSYLSLSRTRRTKDDLVDVSSTKLREVAVAIFKMAYEIITKPESLQQLLDSTDGQLFEEPRLDTRLRLAHFILNSICQAHLDSGKLRDASDSYHRMVQLTAVLQEMGLDLTRDTFSVAELGDLHAAAA